MSYFGDIFDDAESKSNPTTNTLSQYNIHLFLFIERMGDGEYEFMDDSKTVKPPTVKLATCKIKSKPGKGVVSK